MKEVRMRKMVQCYVPVIILTKFVRLPIIYTDVLLVMYFDVITSDIRAVKTFLRCIRSHISIN